MPARDLETGIARILRDHLLKPTVLTDLVRDLSAAEIPGLQEKFRRLAKDCDPDGGADLWAPLLRRADLPQGNMLLRLDRKVPAERLGSEWVKRRQVPTDRDQQRKIVAAPGSLQVVPPEVRGKAPTGCASPASRRSRRPQ